MSNIKHIVKTPYVPTFRSRKVEGQFDLSPGKELTKEWSVDWPLDHDNWNIGVIVGPSGSGKTTLSKKIFDEKYYHKGFNDWPHDKSVLEGFPAHLETEEITKILSSVGFSSPPNWLQPYHTLSMGQQFRVEMARVLFDPREIVVVDEFTSVVDRTVAQIGSSAISKAAKKLNRKLVLLSCHYDILDWLEPDWIYYVDSNKFTWGCLRRPPIEIKVQRCHISAWRIFREHHYLSHSIVPRSECYVATVNGEPAGFFAYVKEGMSKRKNVIRGHRTVILPDFQGIGLGNLVSKKLMKYYSDMGNIVKVITSHPALIHTRVKDKDLRLCRKLNYEIRKGVSFTTKSVVKGMGRITATFQYVGNRKEGKL